MAELSDEYGILYLPFGDRKYVDEALISAHSVRRHMPRLRIGCVTDLDIGAEEFDVVVRLEDASDDYARFGRKIGAFIKHIKGVTRSPFEKTLFLDTDTYCCYPVWDMFSVLLHNDLAAAHAPARTNLIWASEDEVVRHLEKRPYVPHINIGVLAYRRSPETQAFFQVWERLFIERYNPDIPNFSAQSVFQSAVAQTGLKCIFLPVEYNLRVSRPATVLGPVRILHGRPRQGFTELEQLFNFYQGERTLLGMIGVLYLYEEGIVFLTGDNGIKTHHFATYSEFRRCLIDHHSG